MLDTSISSIGDNSPDIKGGHVEADNDGKLVFVYDEDEAREESDMLTGGNKPLTEREIRNAEETLESDTYDLRTHPQK